MEDQLDDMWAQWDQQGLIQQYNNTPHPELRLQFWTRPEREIDLVAGINFTAALII